MYIGNVRGTWHIVVLGTPVRLSAETLEVFQTKLAKPLNTGGTQALICTQTIKKVLRQDNVLRTKGGRDLACPLHVFPGSMEHKLENLGILARYRRYLSC